VLSVADPEVRRLAVFSHPNHELAVLGLVQRFQPHLLFLSDGGAPQRQADTRRGLQSVAISEGVRLMDYPESAYYAALLERDVGFCRRVVADIAAVVDEWQPREIFCDAVEFYNPVHDLCLPLTLAALAGRTDPPTVFEVPLIYQRPAAEEAYEIQRFPAALSAGQRELRLSDAELAAKLHARSTIYGELRLQLSGLLDGLPTREAAREVWRQSSAETLRPTGDRVLRYEWRGKARQARGEVEEIITYADHYQPLVEALLQQSSTDRAH
jgi:hypothetical protein